MKSKNALLKEKAQDMLMHHISSIGYTVGQMNELSAEEQEELLKVMKVQMDRIAKIFGYEEAWFS